MRVFKKKNHVQWKSNFHRSIFRRTRARATHTHTHTHTHGQPRWRNENSKLYGPPLLNNVNYVILKFNAAVRCTRGKTDDTRLDWQRLIRPARSIPRVCHGAPPFYFVFCAILNFNPHNAPTCCCCCSFSTHRLQGCVNRPQTGANDAATAIWLTAEELVKLIGHDARPSNKRIAFLSLLFSRTGRRRTHGTRVTVN